MRVFFFFVSVWDCVFVCVLRASMCIMDFYPSESTAVTVCLTPHGLYYARRRVYQRRHSRPVSAPCLCISVHTYTNTPSADFSVPAAFTSHFHVCVQVIRSELHFGQVNAKPYTHTLMIILSACGRKGALL